MGEVCGGGVDDGTVGAGDAAPGGGGVADSKEGKEALESGRRAAEGGWRRGGVAGGEQAWSAWRGERTLARCVAACVPVRCVVSAGAPVCEDEKPHACQLRPRAALRSHF